MMSPTTDSPSGLGGHIQWSDQAVHIKDFSTKYQIPNIVKVIKGQYRNIGVSKSVSNELYLHSVRTVSKVLAESVKMKEGKSKVVVSDQKYSLPVTYKGWFELLSQDGKSIKAILSVQELARFFPPSCLVRENIKGFVHRGTGELSLDRTRVVHAGEVLNLVGEIWVPFQMGKVMAKRRILKCVDSKGEDIFFGLEQKGTFSPIAGQNNISGVHSIKGLLDKFRLPLMVRLVHGVIPTKMEKGFTGVFRFVNIYSDENAFVCPLKKDTKMVPVSTREALKVVAAHNYEILSTVEEFRVVQKKCTEMLDSYMNSIHILITMPDSSALLKGKQDLQSIDPEVNLSSEIRTEPKHVASSQNNAPVPHSITEDEEDLLFQEIDGIYQYVREGGVPPAPKARSQKPKDSSILDSLQMLNRPDDPSVEIKMQQLDLPEEDEEEGNRYRSVLPRKDSYNWEEPIYEPLDKIREQKKKKENKRPELQPALVSSGFDAPTENDLLEDINGVQGKEKVNGGRPEEHTPQQSSQGISQGPSKLLGHSRGSTPQLNSQQPSIDLGTPVSSLRQVMKSSQPDTPRPKSLAFEPRSSTGQGYTSAPPVPPKRYDSHEPVSGEGAPRSAPRKVKSNPEGMYSNSAGFRGNNVIPGNSYNTSSSSGSSNSAQPTDKKLRHSISSPAVIRPSAPSAHPPYVAVARVGDYQQRPTASVVVNPGVYPKHSNGVMDSRQKLHNITDSRQKLHSMYL